ncbi:hypothetical protein PG987_009570 [Apiospora arundinis]
MKDNVPAFETEEEAMERMIREMEEEDARREAANAEHEKKKAEEKRKSKLEEEEERTVETEEEEMERMIREMEEEDARREAAQAEYDKKKAEEKKKAASAELKKVEVREAKLISENAVPKSSSSNESGKTKRPQASALPVKRYVPYKERKDVNNIRRVLAIAINKHEEKACPDSGSSQNIMREDWARKHKLKIRRRPSDRGLFQLGNGQTIRAMGRVRAYIKIVRAQSMPQSRRKEWFYVFKKCPVPIVLGMPFLDCANILTRNKHLLEVCPKDYSGIDSVLWIGTPRNQMRCSLDGRRAVATADTGSDVNLMSLDYSKHNGYQIDNRPDVRRHLQFGDGSVEETMGQVYVNNFSLDWRSPPTTLSPVEDDMLLAEKSQNGDISDTDTVSVQYHVIFHVLRNLPCGIILGRSLLETTDAFSQDGIQLPFSDPKRGQKKGPACFNVVVDKGGTCNLFKNPFKKAPPPLPVSQDKTSHDNERHAQWGRVSQIEDDIKALMGTARQAKEDELRSLKKRLDTQHSKCGFCT